jgi:hypothetical protein
MTALRRRWNIRRRWDGSVGDAHATCRSCHMDISLMEQRE